ncbi:major facilitator superfamily domain-containing protein [Penicillium malachiteum]|uniref:Major facilitator superfamily domain-containing protein n=1 Tax=Penicillium malachiteum TaxID=1324776 RepID=A0AAD6HDE0_9EURO|nr:major facilitator superfamily domain-containing protein [Penicillium malachiteum]
MHITNFSRIDAATPTWTDINIELGFSYTILDDSYAVGCGTLCIGAFFMIPFALAFGRRPVYLVSTAAQFAICIWSAKMQTITDLMLVNILSCFFGALSEVIVQMIVADVYFVHQRGLMNSIYVWFMNGGANLAPLAAGYITVAQGWRMVWWWMAIFFGICFCAFLLLYEESMYKVSAGVIDGIPTSDSNPKMPAIYSTEKNQEQLPDSIKKLTADDTNVETETSTPQIDNTYYSPENISPASGSFFSAPRLIQSLYPTLLSASPHSLCHSFCLFHGTYIWRYDSMHDNNDNHTIIIHGLTTIQL